MSPGGLLHDINRLSEDDIQLLVNVAPVAPDFVLKAIKVTATLPEGDQQFVTGIKVTATLPEGDQQFVTGNRWGSTIIDLVLHIAYDATLFEGCVELLAKFALAENEGGKAGQYWDRICSLFTLYLSGSEANPDTREAVVQRFLFSDNGRERQLGLGMLKSAFQSRHWSSLGTFEFGARRRSYGYEPATHAEQTRWYRRFVTLGHHAATSDDEELSTGARVLLARELGNLWRIQELREALADLAKDLNDRQPWLEGWRAVRSIKYHDYRKPVGHDGCGGASLLDELDHMLRPRELVDVVRNYVLTSGHERYALDLSGDRRWEESRNRAAAMARDLGMVVADKPNVMEQLSLDLFTTATTESLYEFGRGLASTSKDLRALWDRLVEFLRTAGDRVRQYRVLYGVLAGTYDRDEPLAQQILDSAVEDRILRKSIVGLQTSIPLGLRGVERMGRALDFEDTPTWQFGDLAWHRPLTALSETEVQGVLLKTMERPGGPAVVVDGLYMRMYLLKEDNRTLSPELKRVGLTASAALLRDHSSFHDSGSTDYHLSEFLKSCTDEAEFLGETNTVFDAYLFRLRESPASTFFIEKTVKVLAENATARFLDRVFLDPTLRDHHRLGILREQSNLTNPLSNVSIARLFNWCRNGDFQERLIMISEALFPFKEGPEGKGVVFSDQALAILEETQDPVAVFGNFAFYAGPNSWSGSRADVIAERCRPFETLAEHPRPNIRRAAQQVVAWIKKLEAQERDRERAEDEQREQRFE